LEDESESDVWHYDLDTIEAACRKLRIRIVERTADRLWLDLGDGCFMSFYNYPGDCLCALAVDGVFVTHFHGDYAFVLDSLEGGMWSLNMDTVEFLTGLANGKVLLVQHHEPNGERNLFFLYGPGDTLGYVRPGDRYVVRRAQLLGP